MPCDVCGQSVPVEPNPLRSRAICPGCEARVDLGRAWDAARNKEPCDRCGNSEECHHPTCSGQNLCHTCYQRDGACTQLYRGDQGYPAFPRQTTSLPAVLLPPGEGPVWCVVCGAGLCDYNALAAEFGMPAICESCDGPKWWDYMSAHYGELSQKVMY